MIHTYMKRISITFLIIFCLVCGSNTYANDSLSIENLQNELIKLNQKIDTLNSEIDSIKILRFKPIKFAIGFIHKWNYEDWGELYLIGVNGKFSLKKWDYKHYIYADITCGKHKRKNKTSFALGYFYNIFDYVMLGASFDVLTVQPAVMVNITNDKIFTDLHFSFGKNGIGSAYSIGFCFQ